ncbi:MAG: hypothetical protein ABR516_03525, partial [Desulfuromonadaceae bacterium]
GALTQSSKSKTLLAVIPAQAGMTLKKDCRHIPGTVKPFGSPSKAGGLLFVFSLNTYPYHLYSQHNSDFISRPRALEQVACRH